MENKHTAILPANDDVPESEQIKGYTINRDELLQSFLRTRSLSERICKPLATEDYVPQPVSDVSPPKWHLSHSTWFFEQFILVQHLPGYEIYHPDFAFLFNSYYNNMGDRTQRQDRGFMSRPSVDEVFKYRAHVDKAIKRLLAEDQPQELLKLIEVGINHEQQHQELLVYDIKYILGIQPTFPAIGDFYQLKPENRARQWLSFDGGLHMFGADDSAFAYDNEQPRHKVYIEPFELSEKLVTNAEYLEFMEDGGYSDFNLWHAEGWDFIQNQNIEAPLYWHLRDDEWHYYTFNGLRKVEPDLPVMHISYYEAFAFAEWKGLRVPTEFEWELAADRLQWGSLWEWTQSAYLPYPGFVKVPGALGEYNGKFMLNQNVLRGSSIATPPGHERKTYRNFFHASSRWLFAGLRLAR